VVIRINIRIQDAIEGFCATARQGKIDILYDTATDYSELHVDFNSIYIGMLEETDKIPLDMIFLDIIPQTESSRTNLGPHFTIARLGKKFVSRMTEKVTGGFGWNFQRRLDLTQLRGD